MIENLLEQINLISDKYSKITKAKGENFNLFDIMGMRTNEVKTHSSIIAELLNPNGTHEFGNSFLKLFLEIIFEDIDNNNSFETLKNINQTKSIVEYNIGSISNDLTKGGRIDILLSNKNFEICIENKINAGDQPYQLRRYHNYLSKRKKYTLLIYLTLEGKEASSESICNSQFVNDEWVKKENELLECNKDYFCISYKSTIIKWLDKCYKLSIDKPILRETLKQYIILIKSLTHQSHSLKMEKEIHKTILNNLKGAETIHNSFFTALNEVIISFCNDLKNYLIEKGIQENLIEFRNWKNQNNFFTVFINNDSLPRIGFEIYNGSLAFGETSSMIDLEDSHWGKNPIESWNKDDTFQFLSEYYNGNSTQKREVIKKIYNIIIENKN